MPDSRTALGVPRQMKLYREGLAGNPPTLPIAASEWEAQAMRLLSPQAGAYLGGAGREDTMAANLEAFDHWRICPRMMTDISTRDLSTNLWGLPLRAPVLLAPIGLQELYHRDAEIATARAAAQASVPFILSCQSSRSIEQVAAVAGDTPQFFQLYWSQSAEFTESLVHRAENANYAAIVLTADTKMLGWRERDLALGHNPFLEGKGIANYLSDPVFQQLAKKSGASTEAANVETFLKVFSKPALRWEDLAWLRKLTRLPIVLKGIQHPADAQLAIEHGMDGLIVSNHGGRQVDGGVATLDMLPAIADTVARRIPVGIDSGIRNGADAFKALALGADFVCLGRPYIHALAVAGESGVREFIENFLCDLELTLALSGRTRWSEVTAEMCVKPA